MVVKNADGSFSGIQAVSCGWDGTIFLKNDGTSLACGRNQWPDGTTRHRSNPLQVLRDPGSSGLDNVIASAGGQDHTVYLKVGTVWAIGSNTSQLRRVDRGSK